MIDTKIENGQGHLNVKGTAVDLIADCLILVNWVYKSIYEESENSQIYFRKFCLVKSSML